MRLDPPAKVRILNELERGPSQFAPLLRSTGLRSGTLSQTLIRLEECGAVRRRVGAWELIRYDLSALAWTRGI